MRQSGQCGCGLTLAPSFEVIPPPASGRTLEQNMPKTILFLAIIMATIPAVRASHAATCSTTCYGQGNYRTCNTYCF